MSLFGLKTFIHYMYYMLYMSKPQEDPEVL